jgi:hypothetical protein
VPSANVVPGLGKTIVGEKSSMRIHSSPKLFLHDESNAMTRGIGKVPSDSALS